MPTVRKMASSHSTMAPLHAILEAAKCFGLTDDEVWQAVNESLGGAHAGATVGECLCELVGALAQRILAKQRRSLDDGSSGSP
jgi:hypothetical protein